MKFRHLIVQGLMLAICFTWLRAGEKPQLKIDYEKYELKNGLQVILHDDKSDPIVSVAILYHVGSNREEVGRTGFAHLFEHILFQESQHVGQDQFFKKIQNAGGTLNGGTFEDGTVYYEIVPKNALEMVLWMESDRMGFLLSTVTQEAFENQQSVVQNEKRQRVDNRPYGHTSYVIDKLLYPAGHPYSWQVIGSLADLSNATLKDVHNFYHQWYGPNNATLVIAGDFNKKKTKKLVEKYFGEIKRGPAIEDPTVRLAHLNETKRAFHEDNFANAPELNMIFPTVQQYSDDAYALDVMAELLADGKKAPLYKIVVEEQKLAPSVSAYQNSSEIAGSFKVRIRAFPDKNLTDVEKAIQTSFVRFEKDKFSAADLDRIKAKIETNFYNGISSILSKSFQLALYNEYAGSPDFITKDISKLLAVSSDDIWRVYNKYIKGKNYVLTSFVPKGKTALVAENSTVFPVVEEKIAGLDEAKAGGEKTESTAIGKISSSFDRTVEPAKGPAPKISMPKIWSHTYKNGLKIYGIEQKELPLVQFRLTLHGGHLLDDLGKVGVANLMTDIMMEGTANKTPVELEEAIDGLGASIRMWTSDEAIQINCNTLSTKLGQTYGLFEEILLQPRWDEKEFARVKAQTIEGINRSAVRPASVSQHVFNKLLFGKNHILAYPLSGSAKVVTEIAIDDLKAFYGRYFSPSVSYIAIVGDISKKEAIKLFQPLEKKWPAKTVKFPEYKKPAAVEKSKLYFVDFPKAKQSQIRIGYLALAATDDDYYPAVVMNYKLGGNFNSNVNMILREEKGYTYGARSGFRGGRMVGPFVASAAVQSNATFESLQIFKDELEKYRRGISDADLEFTKNALILSNARRFETLGAIMNILTNIENFGRSRNYVTEHEAFVRKFNIEQHQKLAQKYITPEKMIYLVVGDAETQAGRLVELGFGEPVMLDKNGDPVVVK